MIVITDRPWIDRNDGSMPAMPFRSLFNRCVTKTSTCSGARPGASVGC